MLFEKGERLRDFAEDLFLICPSSLAGTPGRRFPRGQEVSCSRASLHSESREGHVRGPRIEEILCPSCQLHQLMASFQPFATRFHLAQDLVAAAFTRRNLLFNLVNLLDSEAKGRGN